ncbi:MAG TPA: hypothetical protein ENH26_00090 [Candidatus Wolfebacteria bacterium]|nr:hypothetical protein [Candidatus Wolfebacteria bacterium]
MKNETNKQQLLNYLKSQKLMSLATYGDEIAACVVYYAVDDDFNFYFISPQDTQHCINIAKNKNIACSIADSHQKVSDKKIGAQIQGEASEITGKDKIIAVLKMWHQMNPGVESLISFDKIKNKIIESRVYKIKPFRIKFFNEELYGDEEDEVFEF